MFWSIAGAIIGMLLACIGMDPINGVLRFTFGSLNLSGGIALIPALIGFFAITEVLQKVENYTDTNSNNISKVKNVLGNAKDCLQYKWVLVKSSLIGTLIGALPGTGPTIASWVSYNEAKRSSKTPEKFGQGSEEGIIASESANNAVTGGAMIPLLTLGIPGDTVTAILLGALMIQGLTPGPMLLKQNYNILAEILWIFVIAYVFMLILGLFASRIFPYIIRTPMPVMVPIIIVLCIIGGYAYNNSFFDVKILFLLGIIGYVLMKFGFPIPPMVLGLVLGPIIEPNFRRALMGADMNPLVFVTRPVSLCIIILAVIMFILMQRSVKNMKN